MADINIGTPPPVLLPAREHKFVYVTETMELVVPRTVPGQYCIFPEAGVFLFGDMLRALFIHRAYPDMSDNQAFMLLGVESNGDTVRVVGRVIEYVKEG